MFSTAELILSLIFTKISLLSLIARSLISQTECNRDVEDLMSVIHYCELISSRFAGFGL